MNEGSYYSMYVTFCQKNDVVIDIDVSVCEKNQFEVITWEKKSDKWLYIYEYVDKLCEIVVYDQMRQ